MALARRRRARIADSSSEEAPPPSASAPGSKGISQELDDCRKRPKFEISSAGEGASKIASDTSPLSVASVNVQPARVTSKSSSSSSARCHTEAGSDRQAEDNARGQEQVSQDLLSGSSGPLNSQISSTTVSNQNAVDDNQNQFAKIKIAARQYLRAHRADAAMEKRLEMLKKLSSDDAEAFCTSNKNRRKGEWFWEVLDRLADEELPGSNGLRSPEVPLEPEHRLEQEVASNSRAKSKCALEHMGNANDCVTSEQALQSNEVERMATSSAGDSKLANDLLEKNSDRHAMGTSSAETRVHQPSLAISSSSSSSSKATTPSALAPQIDREAEAGVPVLLEAGQRHGIQTRRGVRVFTPVVQRRPGSVTLKAPTTVRWAADEASLSQSSTPSSRSSTCRHLLREAPSTDNGCYWVCSQCGEMLFYDGWERERVARNHLAQFGTNVARDERE